MKFFAILLLSFLLTACAGMQPNTGTGAISRGRGPASTNASPAFLLRNQWRLIELDLRLKNLRGFCDLSGSNERIVILPMNHTRSGATLIYNLHMKPTDLYSGCMLQFFKFVNANYEKTSYSPMLGALFYFQIKNNQNIAFSYISGLVGKARNEEEFTRYSLEGYDQVLQDRFLMEMEAIFLVKKQFLDDRPNMLAHCEQTGLRGMLGFRKKIVSCYLPEGQGTVKFEEI